MLAVHEPVAVLDLGIVVKIDLKEGRAPFVRAGLQAGLVDLVLIAIGTILFLRVGTKNGNSRNDRMRTVILNWKRSGNIFQPRMETLVMKKILVALTALLFLAALLVHADGFAKARTAACRLGITVDVSLSSDGTKILYNCKIDRGCGNERGLVGIRYYPSNNYSGVLFSGLNWQMEQLVSDLPPGTQKITIKGDVWDRNSHHKVDEDSLQM